MSLFRFTLDGTLLADEPEGWQRIVSELRRDKEARGQLLLMDLTVLFRGGTDGYAALKPKYDCEGFCSFSTLSVDQYCNGTWTEIYDGILFYTLIKEYLSPCVLECKLKDNSFAAKIDNNKNIEAYVNVGRSKNDETITAAQAYTVKLFDVLSGVNTSQARVYPVWSCFEFIIDYMTDGEMGFTSDYFYGNLLSGDGRFLTITTGNQIRVGNSDPLAATIFPFISFQKLFDEVNKKINIGFNIETDINGNRVMRIEPMSYFYQQSSALTLNDARNIIKSTNTAELYSKLKIGSAETLSYNDPGGGCDQCFPTGISFVGYQEESYTLTGKCNIDAELNLVSDWIIDSNVIQSVKDGNDGYEEDIFFVMADYIDALPVAIQYDVFANGPPFFYNGFLRNSEVATRWFGAVPNSIALYLGPGGDEFQASGTDTYSPFPATPISTYTFSINPAFPVIYEPVSFQDDFNTPNFDTNGNYNNTNYRYVSPATGIYTMAASLPFDVKLFPPLAGGIRIRGYFRLYNNLSVLQDTFQFADSGNITFSTDFIFNLSGSRLIYIPTTYYVQVAIQVESVDPTHIALYLIQPGRTFACTQAETGGGVYATYNPEDFKAYQYEFDYPITFANFQTIIADPLKQLTVNDGSNEIIAWIDNMKYDHKTGIAKFVLTNSLQLTLCE